MDIVLLGLVVYAVAMTVGYLVNKQVRLPWMFSIVILGMTFAATGLFKETLDGPNLLCSPGWACCSFCSPSAWIST